MTKLVFVNIMQELQRFDSTAYITQPPVPLALLAGIVSNERVVGLSNMVMVATCAAASVAHFRAEQVFAGMPGTVGKVCLSLAPLVFVGSQIGSPLGRRINEKLSLRRRRVVLGILLMVIAVRLAYRTITGGST